MSIVLLRSRLAQEPRRLPAHERRIDRFTTEREVQPDISIGVRHPQHGLGEQLPFCLLAARQCPARLIPRLLTIKRPQPFLTAKCPSLFIRHDSLLRRASSRVSSSSIALTTPSDGAPATWAQNAANVSRSIPTARRSLSAALRSCIRLSRSSA